MTPSQLLPLRVEPIVAYNPLRLQAEISTTLAVDINRIKHFVVRRRSIDARQRRVLVNLEVEVWLDKMPEPEELKIEPTVYPDVHEAPRQAIVVGAGPAGLFAALELIRQGIRPILLERGKDVEDRAADMARIAGEGIVDPDSNYCFGEGGAGAYSDGKLYTRSKKRGDTDHILRIFVEHGADPSILVDAHPHIGTDRLPLVIRAMRHTILNAGGEVHFSTRVTGLLREGNRVTGVETADGKRYEGSVILATGHSARDIYRYLAGEKIAIEPKGLAVGVRLEHPQQLIDQIQYHNPNGRGKYLPAAEYSMLTRVDGRGVYSFCMCPGGVVIPAATEPGQIVVNGMSPAARSGRWANSGMVVEVLPEDIPGSDPLRLMRFQEGIEHQFFAEAQHWMAENEAEDTSNRNPNNSTNSIVEAEGSEVVGDGRRGSELRATQSAPAQRMTDFVGSRPSRDLPATSYAPGIHPARLDKLLPPEIAHRLQRGFEEFGRKQRGFLSPQAVLIGAETRTSSPVRIPRDPATLSHIELQGLYPCGEGAGYAGGIVSAAIDGRRAAQALANG